MDVRAVAHLSVAGITVATGTPPLWLTTNVYWPSAGKIKSRTKLCDTNGHGDTGSLTAEKPCWRMRWPPPACSWQSMSASAPGGISSLSLTFSLSLCASLSLSLSLPLPNVGPIIGPITVAGYRCFPNKSSVFAGSSRVIRASGSSKTQACPLKPRPCGIDRGIERGNYPCISRSV